MEESLFQLAGWIGAACIVIAYYLITYKKVNGGSASYQALNLLGCIGVGINAYHQATWPSVGLQIVWALIAITGLIRNR